MSPGHAAALVWLLPQVALGPVEATAGRAGLRAGAAVHGTLFEAAAGCGYTALRAQIVYPPSDEGLGGVVEAEHEWGRREFAAVRASVPVGGPIWLTHELRARPRPAWRSSADPSTGRRRIRWSGSQQFYLTLAGRLFVARVGVSDQPRGLDAALIARW